MQKEYEVIVALPEAEGKITYARMQHRNRIAWKTKRIAEKHAREYKITHLRDAWVSEVV